MREHCPPNLVTRPRQWTVKQTPFYYLLILSLWELESGGGEIVPPDRSAVLTHRKKGKDYGPAWKAQAARAIDLGLVGEGLETETTTTSTSDPQGCRPHTKGAKGKASRILGNPRPVQKGKISPLSPLCI